MTRVPAAAATLVQFDDTHGLMGSLIAKSQTLSPSFGRVILVICCTRPGRVIVSVTSSRTDRPDCLPVHEGDPEMEDWGASAERNAPQTIVTVGQRPTGKPLPAQAVDSRKPYDASASQPTQGSGADAAIGWLVYRSSRIAKSAILSLSGQDQRRSRHDHRKDMVNVLTGPSVEEDG